MKTLTDEKLTIVGAAGMIGSNMAQTAIMMGLTSNICLYDPYAPGLEGVAEELFHCGFEGVNITFTSDIKEALTGAKYIVNSGGAARKAGMTREDLLKGNAAIAEEFGKNVKAYCPDVKHIVVIFNPADITGLITLLYSGLKPSQVTTLAALDSTRLRSELAKHFGVSMDVVENCRTYGGHGEQMAVYASTAKVEGKPLAGMIGTDALTKDRWAEIQTKVTKGGANIIALRGRSSFQSPSYVSIEMIAAAMGGKPFRWPAGALCLQWQVRPYHDGVGNFHYKRRRSIERSKRNSGRRSCFGKELQTSLRIARRSDRNGCFASDLRVARIESEY